MQNLPYTSQTSDSIRLYTMERAIPHEQLQIVKKEDFSTSFGEVSFGVLSESHYVTVTAPTFQFSEVLACTELIDFTPIRFEQLLKKTTAIAHPRYVYECQLWVAEIETETNTNPNNSEYYLRQEFPSSTLHEFAVTEISLTIHNQNELEVRTQHTYPEEMVSVCSKSLLTCLPT